MATMFPKAVPPHVSADPFRSAEIQVFEALESQLGEEFFVFYSRPWLGLSPRGEEIDGEADFVIVHERLGMLCLEVKGGEIEYNAENDRWRTTNRYGFTSVIKDPVYQARTCKHRLLEKMRASKSFSLPHIRARHGVIFPHSEKPADDLGPDRPLTIFCFTDQFAKVGAWVAQRMGIGTPLGAPEQPLTALGVKAFVNSLARSFQLRVPAVVEIRREEKEIDYLSTEQFWILDFLSNHPRCAVSGPAGTGKTVLAIEKAVRCAEYCLETILLCFNRPLANHLKARIGSREHLSVLTFHEFVLKSAQSAGLEVPREIEGVTRDEWALLLMETAKVSDLKIEALIIDEGQDFCAEWWEALETCLEPDSLLYVFYDNQQQLYEMPAAFARLIPQAPFPLTNNLRNSKQIFRVAAPWFGSAAARPLGPDGPPVLWTELDNKQSITKQLSDLVGKLLDSEHIAQSQITILSTMELDSENFRVCEDLKRLKLQQVDKAPQSSVTCSGVRRFKGLDNAVVVLVIPEGTLPEKELLYVGLTRARSLLCIVGRPEILTALKAKSTITKSV
ncbi:MAG TPA: NERD domain-containing protein [Clostridia bacterium]|nr:NERD domain-containing protein [Clostridia bacterium]